MDKSPKNKDVDPDKTKLLYREDFVGQRPCLLADGTIRTNTQDFSSVEELQDYLLTRDYIFAVDVDKTHAENRWIGAMAGLDQKDYHPVAGFSFLVVPGRKGEDGSYDLTAGERLCAESYTYNNPVSGGVEPVSQLEMDFNLPTCPASVTAPEVDREVLRNARPELSTFTAKYPLTATQASVLTVILDNIEHINLDRLFKSLLPSFVEAIEVGMSRRIIDDEFIKTDNYSDVYQWMREILELVEAEGIDRLPTVKEVLNKNITTRYWN